jgi:hypothetical protein
MSPIPVTNTSLTSEPNVVYADPGIRSGWLVFAGTILGLAGVMRILDALWAFRYSGALPDSLEDGLLGDNLDSYGWLWLGVGLILLFSSFAVLNRSQLARWIGIFAGCVMSVSAVAMLPYFPVWSLIYIAIAVFVIYALAVHGGREDA